MFKHFIKEVNIGKLIEMQSKQKTTNVAPEKSKKLKSNVPSKTKKMVRRLTYKD